jgi:hypothetical protein
MILQHSDAIEDFLTKAKVLPISIEYMLTTYLHTRVYHMSIIVLTRLEIYNLHQYHYYLMYSVRSNK